MGVFGLLMKTHLDKKKKKKKLTTLNPEISGRCTPVRTECDKLNRNSRSCIKDTELTSGYCCLRLPDSLQKYACDHGEAGD